MGDTPGHDPGGLERAFGDGLGMDAINYANCPVVSADWGGRGCRVIGCTEDIYSQRPVNLKYRLCRTHKGADALIVNGQPKRFCSQCSTFKHITEFNGKMRACRPCLVHRSANRNSKRDFLHTLVTGSPTHTVTPAAPPAAANWPVEQQQNAAQLTSAAMLENAQIDAFMAGAALAEILRNNGNNEPYATAAAMVSAAAARGSAAGQHVQQQQQQHRYLPQSLPPPPRIVSTTTAATANGNTQLRPDPQIDSEILQQESALAALLTAASMGVVDTENPINPESRARDDALASYQALLAVEQPTHGGLPLPLPQSTPQQQPLWSPPALHSLVENKRNRDDPSSSTNPHSPSTIAKGLVLKRQRVLAELHLAKTNLELAQVEEEIYTLRHKHQQQQMLAAATAAAAAAANGGGAAAAAGGASGSKSPGVIERRKLVQNTSNTPTEMPPPNGQTNPGTPSRINQQQQQQ